MDADHEGHWGSWHEGHLLTVSFLVFSCSRWVFYFHIAESFAFSTGHGLYLDSTWTLLVLLRSTTGRLMFVFARLYQLRTFAFYPVVCSVFSVVVLLSLHGDDCVFGFGLRARGGGVSWVPPTQSCCTYIVDVTGGFVDTVSSILSLPPPPACSRCQLLLALISTFQMFPRRSSVDDD